MRVCGGFTQIASHVAALQDTLPQHRWCPYLRFSDGGYAQTWLCPDSAAPTARAGCDTRGRAVRAKPADLGAAAIAAPSRCNSRS